MFFTYLKAAGVNNILKHKTSYKFRLTLMVRKLLHTLFSLTACKNKIDFLVFPLLYIRVKAYKLFPGIFPCFISKNKLIIPYL